MNTRVLELVKNPKIITESDLDILRSESEKMPYAQSIRALYLYGINLYKPENYKENLSKTAAYTTDKKILYQFINSEKFLKKEESTPIQETIELISENQEINQNINEQEIPVESEIITEIENTETHSVLNKFDVEKIIETENAENSEFIVVDGEKNRLLYEGEENFLGEKNAEIDLEASQESGQLVLKEETENIDSQIIIDDNRAEESIISEQITEPQPDIILEVSKPETAIEPDSDISSHDISFGGAQEFLPNVKFSIPKNHLDYLNPQKKEAKEEKPIEITIEKKNSFVEKLPEKEVEIEDNHEISFENTQAFEISEKQEIKNQEIENEASLENTQTFENVENKAVEPEVLTPTEITKTEVVQEEPVSEWKPMSFSANTPDALIGKSTPIPEKEIAPKEEVIVSKAIEKALVTEEKNIDEIKEAENRPSESERLVFNVSFFGDEVSKIEEKKEDTIVPDKTETGKLPESNVGTFINTWQSWLKIERPETKEEPSKVKEKIIDNFIETNPKISQLKEESSYIVKEKKDDISHLMTETLAKLYTEQKLYSKAVKAYEILSEKHPEKKDYFEEKIEEIKEIRKS